MTTLNNGCQLKAVAMTVFFPKKIHLGHKQQLLNNKKRQRNNKTHDARIRQIEMDFIGVYQPNPRHLYFIFYLPSSQISPLPNYSLAQKNASIVACA